MKPTIRTEYNLSERVTQFLVKHIHDNDLKPDREIAFLRKCS